MTDEQVKKIKFLFSRKVQAKEQKIYFRDLFREARVKAQSNSENFEDIIFVLEKFGSFLRCENGDLGKYAPYICKVAEKSSLSIEIPKKSPEFHTDFTSLYDLVKDGRNSAMHEGVFARNLTQHAVEISLVLEDALMSNEKKAKDFMMRNPVCAFDWQPLSFIRQNMLSNSFSYLPIFRDNRWKLVSDLNMSKYLRESLSKAERRKRLSQKLKDSRVELMETKIVSSTDEIKQVIKNWDGLPICVTLKNSSEEIVGILTPFDLL